MFTPNNLPDCNKRKCEECSFWSTVLNTYNCEQRKKFMDGYAKNMDFSDALKALYAGNKLRYPAMIPGTYIIMDKNGILMKDENGHILKECRTHCHGFPTEYLYFKDWEVVEHIPPIKTAKIYATSWFIDCPYCGKQINLKLSGDIYKCWNCEKDVKAIVEEDKHEKEVINKLKAELNEVIETMENEVGTYKENSMFLNANEAEIKRQCFKWCLRKLEEFE